MIGVEAPTFFIDEGVSGTKPLSERPAGKELLAKLERGDVIICAKLDRMFRSALDALTMVQQFKDRGVHLHLIDLGGDVAGNGISKLFFTIISAVAEAERDRIVQRILDVKRDQKRQGKHLGGKRPFGFQIGGDGKLVEDEREQAAISKARAMHAAGESLRTIQAALVASGHKVSHVTVNRILKSERAGA
jgi:DNA invertase Pin-like site-specific DNA recombinase